MNYHHKPISQKTWWGPVWRGLVVDSKAKHIKAMRSAVFLYLYCVIHADRKTGHLIRKYETIARDMGVKARSVRYWLLILRKAGYVKVDRPGSSGALSLQIQKWKSIIRPA